ncbi:MAG: HNH endonuclease [Gammaproteobacteria bacterium]|nr:HNH endonuclease [Gammaproteobacteria bacterium]
MDRVRCLTPKGIGEFGRYLKELRIQGELPPPRALLTDDACSVPSALGDVWVEPRNFASRRDFAEYINNRFVDAGVFVNADEPGMWEWLSLYYFDEACPPNNQGFRKPGVEGRHLLRDQDARRRHRHLLRSPYLLYRKYEGGPNGELDLLLSYALPVHGVAATHIGERSRLLTSPGALVAASRLYFDLVAKKPRLGYSNEENGLRAYCKFVNNLPECFDVSGLSADTVIGLLPQGFEIWMADSLDEHGRETRNLTRQLASVEMTSQFAVAEHLDDLLQDIHERRVTERQATVRSDLFRAAVVGAYDSTCAVSGLGLRHTIGTDSTRHEVEAAHIIPVSQGGRDRVQNGLALNRTIHWAFDQGMLWVDSNFRVSVAGEVEKDERNHWLKQFLNRPLKLPANTRHRPHPDALHWHAKNVAASAATTGSN